VGYYLTRKVFSIAKPSIAATFLTDLQDIAHIWTAYLVAYVFGQFISSFVGRGWGPRVLLLGGLGLSIVFNVVFGFTNSYPTFLVFMFFNGLVESSGWAGSVEVAGNHNAVAVAGLVNGLGSISAMFQEEVIGWLMRGEGEASLENGIRSVSLLTRSMSLVFVMCMAVLTWRLGRVRRPVPQPIPAKADS